MREPKFEQAVPEQETLLELSLVEQISDQVKERVRRKVEEYRKQHIAEGKIDLLANRIFTLVLEGKNEDQLERELKEQATELAEAILRK